MANEKNGFTFTTQERKNLSLLSLEIDKQSNRKPLNSNKWNLESRSLKIFKSSSSVDSATTEKTPGEPGDLHLKQNHPILPSSRNSSAERSRKRDAVVTSLQ